VRVWGRTSVEQVLRVGQRELGSWERERELRELNTRQVFISSIASW